MNKKKLTFNQADEINKAQTGLSINQSILAYSYNLYKIGYTFDEKQIKHYIENVETVVGKVSDNCKKLIREAIADNVERYWGRDMGF